MKIFQTLLDVLEGYCGSHDVNGYYFLNNNIEQFISFADIAGKAREIAGYIQSLPNYQVQGRAIIFCNPGLDFILAAYAALYAGLVIVPINPDKYSSEDDFISLNLHIRPQLIITANHLSAKYSEYLVKHEQLNNIIELNLNNIISTTRHVWSNPDLDSNSLAMLQYTSGTTGPKKCVMLSHGNLLHNLELISKGFSLSKADKGVIWLPPYHDMGFIGGILQPLFGGFSVILFSPLEFVRNPIRWLKVIAKYKATCSGGPNFSYDLCIKKYSPDIAGLDLSSWQVAFVGAEQIKKSTLEKFSNLYSTAKFSSRAFYPCYGLSEATLIVSGGLRQEKCKTHNFRIENKCAILRKDDEINVQSSNIISVGPVLVSKYLIVDPSTEQVCHELQIGEIWLQGNTVAKGYWGDPELSKAKFEMSSSISQGKYLRTGDLGFIYHNELYLLGRMDDLIALNGNKISPEYIESVLIQQYHQQITQFCLLPCPDANGNNNILLVCECNSVLLKAMNYSDVCSKLLADFINLFHFPPREIILLKSMTLPRTHNGKIKRNLALDWVLQQKLKPVFTWSNKRVDTNIEKILPRVYEEKKLAEIFSSILGIEYSSISINDDFFSLNGSSIQALSLVNMINNIFHTDLTLHVIYKPQTIAELALTIAKRQAELYNQPILGGA